MGEILLKYAFCIIAVLVQVVAGFLILRERDKEKAALRMPMVYIGGVYLVIQFFVYFKYCRYLPERYAVLLQGALLVLFIIIEVGLSGSNSYIRRVDSQMKESTEGFREILQSLNIKRVEFNGLAAQGYLDALYEKMKFSDPTGGSETNREDKRLSELIRSMDTGMSVEKIKTRCAEAEKVLAIRNQKNKVRK